MDGHRFIVIGENIHTTRSLRVGGSRVVSSPDGEYALPFLDEAGRECRLSAAEAAIEGIGERVRIKHVKAAVLAGLAGGPAAPLGRGYVRSLARRQAAAGAGYLDLNVDEVGHDLTVRIAAMEWLVRAVEDATPTPLAIDSSAPEVLRAGLAAARRLAGPPLLNSASLERLDVLELAAAEGCPVVLSATGAHGMPASAADRIENAMRIVSEAARRGVPLDRIHLDALVMPVAVEPSVGAWFLEAIRALRAELGPRIHLTGGLSNVSFGLPARRLINDVFIGLAMEAGADSGIIDPVANDPGRPAWKPGGPAYARALDLLLGRDEYAAEFLSAYRAGAFAAESPLEPSTSGVAG
jgi:hypothetical protein